MWPQRSSTGCRGATPVGHEDWCMYPTSARTRTTSAGQFAVTRFHGRMHALAIINTSRGERLELSHLKQSNVGGCPQVHLSCVV
jgi:hypothetical protein